MSKLRVILVGAAAAGALAAGSFMPAFADPLVPTQIGELHVHGTGPDDGKIIADGAPTNPAPFDGYLSVSSDGVCTGSGGPEAAEDEACNTDIQP